MLELTQYVAASLLALSGIPGAVSAVRHGCSTSSVFLWTWAVGAGLSLWAFAVPFNNIPLGVNYTVSSLCGFIMIYCNKPPTKKALL